MKKTALSLSAAILLLAAFAAGASDRSDAEALMNKCESSSKAAAVPVRNFGDKDQIASFEKALDLIKQGKVRLLQSKFLDAKAKFEEYLGAENDIYGSLAPSYLERARRIVDEVAEDLVDFATVPEVLKAFTDASRSLDEAKANLDTRRYLAAIQSCRVSKNHVLKAYALAKKDLPQKYGKDAADSAGKIFLE